MRVMIWNPDNLVEYAKDHSIKECANKYGCSRGTMSSYMYRHKIRHCEGRPKGVDNPLYKHGHSNTRLHKVWQNMRNRCYNSNTPDYKYYGGRGIKICKDWNDFTVFELWAMSNGYSDTLTLDRIDVNGDYCPANCRWATRKEQSNNKRNLHIIEHKGEIKTLTEWSKTLNIPISTLYRYLASEKSLEKAIDKFQRRKICVVS